MVPHATDINVLRHGRDMGPQCLCWICAPYVQGWRFDLGVVIAPRSCGCSNWTDERHAGHVGFAASCQLFSHYVDVFFCEHVRHIVAWCVFCAFQTFCPPSVVELAIYLQHRIWLMCLFRVVFARRSIRTISWERIVLLSSVVGFGVEPVV